MHILKNKRGVLGGVMGNVVGLIVGVGIATLVMIMVGVLGGQAYQLTESKITAISNTTIRATITDSIGQGFVALQTAAQYLPLIILAVVIAIVLALVLGMGVMGGGQQGGGAL